MRLSRGALAASVLLFAPTLAAAGQTVEADGRVTAVTVYQGQALVTRRIELPDEAGLVEVVVGDLPERIVPGSLYAEPGEGVEVRSVRYRVRPVERDNRAEVRELNERIGEVEYEIAALDRERALLGERAVYLKGLEKFTTVTAKAELKSGVLDADTLRELTSMVFDERAGIANRELEIRREGDGLKKRLELLRRELGLLTSGASATRREAVVFVESRAGGESVRLTYLVSGATWSPSYNLRADEGRSEVLVEYNASVEQTSGEDWTDVAMTLSTATPSLAAKAPEFSPLLVSLVAGKNKTRAPMRQSRSELGRQQRLLADNRGRFAAPPGNWVEMAKVWDNVQPAGSAAGGFGGAYADDGLVASRLDSRLNSLACSLQVLDLGVDGSGGRPAGGEVEPPSTEGMSVVYRLENRTSLPSRPDRQLIGIAKLPLKADFYRVASPLLTSFVYEEAELTNDAGVVLLAGPAATFLGDRFVGRGEAPSVASGESFTVGFGVDESLRARRELLDKVEKVRGGNRVARLEYRLTIENFAGEAVQVRLLDRIPTSKGDEIKVTLVEADPAVVDGDADAEQREKQGLLRWDLTAPGRESSPGEAAATYTLEIEHDRNLVVAGAGATP